MNTENPGPKQKRREGGQGLVEFALILPVLLLTVLLFIYFAELFHTWSGMQSAAVVAARRVSDTGSTTSVANTAQQWLSANSIDPATVAVQWRLYNADGSIKACGGPCVVEFGDLVTVELIRPFEIGVLDWRATGHLRASHQVRVQHGTWVP